MRRRALLAASGGGVKTYKLSSGSNGDVGIELFNRVHINLVDGEVALLRDLGVAVLCNGIAMYRVKAGNSQLYTNEDDSLAFYLNRRGVLTVRL